MTEHESQQAEAALAATRHGGNGGNGNKLAEALAQMMKPVNALLDSLLGRIEEVEQRTEALETGRGAFEAQVIRHIDERFDQHNTVVVGRLDELERGRTQNQESIQEALARMERMNKSVEMLSATFKGSADHRRETNQKVVETVDDLKTKVEELEQRDAARLRLEQEAKELASRRHAETVALMQSAQQDMRSSFNIVNAIVPGAVVWLAQGGLHASVTGALYAAGVTVIVIAWNFVPACVRWLRLKFGH